MEEHRHNGRLRQHGTRQVVTNVDDTDPIIIYGGNWGLKNWSPAYNGTLHFTRLSMTSITYRFTGSSIAVYGPVGVTAVYGTPITTYQLDDAAPVSFTAPLVPGNDTLTNVLFFSTDNLDAAQHTLTIKRVSTDDAMYFFDFMQIGPDPLSVPLRTSIAAPVPSAATSTPAGITLAAPQASASSQSPAVASAIPLSISGQPSSSEELRVSTTASASLPFAPTDSTSVAGFLSLSLTGTGASSNNDPTPSSASAPPHKSTTTPYIAAGVVIGVVALLAAAGILYCVLRMKRHRSYKSIVQPFDGRRLSSSDLHADTDGPSPDSATCMIERSPASALGGASIEDVYSSFGKAGGVEESTASRHTSSPTSAQDLYDTTPPPTLPRMTMPVHDTDAGIRLGGGPLNEDADNDEPVLLPPAYSSTFGGERN
ncbi:hypothetical protein BDW22DRAFT_586277 [Trametopsis cervina]|nr:hypothetical protein BDW22DRAFT_586277 [Trametopsis cervina]